MGYSKTPFLRWLARCLQVTAVGVPLSGAWSLPAEARPYRFVTRTPGVVDYWPRFSPDGTTILFSRCQISTGCGNASTSGYWELFNVPRSGGEATLLVSLPDVAATRSNWRWTAGSLTAPIAFTGVSVHSGAGQLWLTSPHGGGTFPVATPDDVATGYPSWFPDGSAVTVSGQPKTSSAPFLSLVSVPDGRKITQFTSIDVIWTGESAVSRDGTQLAFAGQLPLAGNQYSDSNNQIWVQAIDPALHPVNDAFSPDLHALDGLPGRTPDWSPNDRFLIFESTRGCLNGNYAIFIEASSGGKAIQVTDCRLNANHAVWSPDGRRFAFSGVFGRTLADCTQGCRGIAVAPVPASIRRRGTAD